MHPLSPASMMGVWDNPCSPVIFTQMYTEISHSPSHRWLLGQHQCTPQDDAAQPEGRRHSHGCAKGNGLGKWPSEKFSWALRFFFVVVVFIHGNLIACIKRSLDFISQLKCRIRSKVTMRLKNIITTTTWKFLEDNWKENTHLKLACQQT